MKSLKIFILLCLFLIPPFLYGITPYNEKANDFNATVETIVYQSNDNVIYKYVIRYDKNNKRDLTVVRIIFPQTVLQSMFVNAYGIADRNIDWYGSFAKGEDKNGVSFYARGENGKPGKPGKYVMVNQYMRLYEKESSLKAGETLTLYFIMKKGGVVPGMADLEGFCSRAMWIFEDAGDAPPDFDDGYYPKVFKVIGPVAEPQNPSGFISALIEWTVYSYNKGWISSYDVYQGLMDKLSAAMGQILQGKEKYHTAVNILGAFQNLLDAQRGKAITEQCYQMLYVDAEILIKRLKS